jgi:uncharacterized protein (DUF2164 family)
MTLSEAAADLVARERQQKANLELAKKIRINLRRMEDQLVIPLPPKRIVEWVTDHQHIFPILPSYWYNQGKKVVIEHLRRTRFRISGTERHTLPLGIPVFDTGHHFWAGYADWGSIVYQAAYPNGRDGEGYLLWAGERPTRAQILAQNRREYVLETGMLP